MPPPLIDREEAARSRHPRLPKEEDKAPDSADGLLLSKSMDMLDSIRRSKSLMGEVNEPGGLGVVFVWKQLCLPLFHFGYCFMMYRHVMPTTELDVPGYTLLATSIFKYSPVAR